MPIDRVASVQRLLTSTAGGYLHNVVRDAGRTCSICTTPVDGYPTCWRCSQSASLAGVADLVVPLTYAIAGQQSAVMLRHYKDDLNAGVRFQHLRIINWLLYLGLAQHQPCIEALVGQPITRRLAIPSLRGRPGLHPFLALAHDMGAADRSPLLAAAPHATEDRIVTDEQFVLCPPIDLTGQHVLILDDTWTTGSRAQSAALTLRRAGAERISVLVIGRWVDPDFADNARFLGRGCTRDYDPQRCPVTGATCP
ncbi:hypothetical protein EV580_6648 [Mycobacterium sp. BK086]|uniref:amidophosphoribosyltransferase n=1 Tax=Mycobacterium sp. BK086 TaxID=2512165 RepID=UPI00105F1590|nr:amidophosphoribosyltransferase [Mycobacterium sp. BK086]TDO06548.1 hypothetical protein EV580_6648 [Mycobacterium sp. BK086]